MAESQRLQRHGKGRFWRCSDQVIAGLLARGLECTDAAFLGVYVHGLAGEEAARRWGIHSVLAGNLADCILCHREMRSMTWKSQS